MQGRFRWKAILLLAVCSAPLGVGWFFLHKHQVTTLHGQYLTLAKRAEEKKDLERAARFLSIYLSVTGDDIDARARYGVLLQELAQKPKALDEYERVLEQDETNQDIRMRAAKLSMELRRFEHALTLLQKADSNDPEVNFLQGDCEWAKKGSDKAKQQAQWKAAEHHYRKAISRAPHKLEAYTRLAQLLRIQQKKPKEGIPVLEDVQLAKATQVMEDLIRANGQEFRAYLIRAAFRQSGDDLLKDGLAPSGAKMLGWLGLPLGQGSLFSASALFAPKIGRDLAGAGQDLANARELARDDADVLMASASHEQLQAREKGQTDPKSHLDIARVYLQRAGKLRPQATRVLPQLADVELAAGRRKEALEVLRTAYKKATGRERNDLLWKLASLLVDDDNSAEAQELIGQMKNGGVPTHRLDFLSAKMAIMRGEWLKAVDLLENARPMLMDNPGLVMQTDLLLGLCFGQLDNTDQQVVIYQRARKLDPRNPAPQLALARALSALGKLDDAIEECQKLRLFPNAPLENDFLYARLLIQKNSTLPPSEAPDWNEVSIVLQEVVLKDNSKVKEVDILRAEVALAQGMSVEAQGKYKEAKGEMEDAERKFKEAKGKFEEAQKILEEAKKKSPKDIEPWIALAALAGRGGSAGSIAGALKILELAEREFHDRPELRLAKLRYVPAKKELALAFLKPLGENLDGFDHSSQGQLLAGLAEAFERAGDLAEAEKMLQKSAYLKDKQQQRQLRARLFLFDFYLRTANPEGMAKTVAMINEIEGKDGLFGHYTKAQLLIFRAGARVSELARQKSQLTPEEMKLTSDERYLAAQARDHLDVVAKKRPSWSRVLVSLATIAEMEGKTDLAIKHWRNAFDLGNRQLPVIKALVAKLGEKHRYEEVDRILSKLAEVEPITDTDLQRRLAETSLFTQQFDRALELTKKAVSRNSKDYKEYLWQAQMLAALGMEKDAESSLQTAIRLDPKATGPWMALIQLQARTGDSKRVLDTLEKMKANVPASKLPFTLAQCYQIIGEKDKAEKAFLEALRTQPDDLVMRKIVLESMVRFQMSSGKPKETEKYLRELLEPKLQASEELKLWSRRNLAVALGYQETPEKHTEAMNLIDENLKANPDGGDDQVVKGLLLATKVERRRDAIGMLEKAFRAKQPTADQMYVLANLYDAEGNWPKARGQMGDLLRAHAKHEKYLGYLAAFIDKLMIHSDFADVEDFWLPRLHESIKNDLEAKESERSDPLAKRLTRDISLLTNLVRRHPRLTDSILPEGELLRSLARKTGKKENLLALAEFLATCQRPEESLDLCEQVINELPVQQVVTVAVAAVGNAKASQKQIQRVEALVKSAREQKPKFLAWDVFSAVLQERQARYSEAEILYRKVLKLEPKNVVAVNNLAFLLGLQGKGEEANTLIKKAIDLAGGPAGELLDSRAVILRAQKKLPEAEKDLLEALGQERTAYRLFHLYEVQQAAGKTKESRRVFLEAIQRGLHIGMMHPLERESYEKAIKTLQ
jgi:tetratricopeptide (TPR) repeat protein